SPAGTPTGSPARYSTSMAVSRWSDCARRISLSTPQSHVLIFKTVEEKLMSEDISNERAEEIVQPFGHLLPAAIGLSAEVRHKSVAALNRLLAHTLALRDLYKKAHWQTHG